MGKSLLGRTEGVIAQLDSAGVLVLLKHIYGIVCGLAALVGKAPSLSVGVRHLHQCQTYTAVFCKGWLLYFGATEHQ
mgnify:CR=1 FL=1